MNKLRKGDEVIVLTGRDSGKRGRVLERVGERLRVEGINMVKRHTRPNPAKGIDGGIISQEAPIHQSNLALFNPATSKGGRVGFKFLEDGNKVRIFKSSGEVVSNG